MQDKISPNMSVPFLCLYLEGLNHTSFNIIMVDINDISDFVSIESACLPSERHMVWLHPLPFFDFHQFLSD